MRKMIHIFSSAIPISYLFLDKQTVLFVIAPLLVLSLLTEIVKYNSPAVYSLYVKVFGPMLREHEANRKRIRITGASWLLLADVLCIILFPKLIAITGMLIVSLSDSSSAIIGRLYGKKQFAPNRSYIGTLTFFVTGIIIIFLTPKYSYLPSEYIFGLAAVIAATIVDSINFPTDDNFSIPLTACAVLYLFYVIFLPSVL